MTKIIREEASGKRKLRRAGRAIGHALDVATYSAERGLIAGGLHVLPRISDSPDHFGRTALRGAPVHSHRKAARLLAMSQLPASLRQKQLTPRVLVAPAMLFGGTLPAISGAANAPSVVLGAIVGYVVLAGIMTTLTTATAAVVDGVRAFKSASAARWVSAEEAHAEIRSALARLAETYPEIEEIYFEQVVPEGEDDSGARTTVCLTTTLEETPYGLIQALNTLARSDSRLKVGIRQGNELSVHPYDDEEFRLDIEAGLGSNAAAKVVAFLDAHSRAIIRVRREFDSDPLPIPQEEGETPVAPTSVYSFRLTLEVDADQVVDRERFLSEWTKAASDSPSDLVMAVDFRKRVAP